MPVFQVQPSGICRILDYTQLEPGFLTELLGIYIFGSVDLNVENWL